MKTFGAIPVVLGMLLMTACEKEEIPVQPHDPGAAQTVRLVMGSDYTDQVWFDLQTGSEVARTPKLSWDIAFQNGDSGRYITLNSAKLMFAAPAGTADPGLVTDTSGLIFRWDASSGAYDSTAIGEWWNSAELFVLDLGLDEKGKHLGFRKVLFDSVTGEAYHFRYCGLHETHWKSARVVKNDRYNAGYFSFRSGEQVAVAPEKNRWDLVFTQYTFVFYDEVPVMPYLVTGVLLNRHSTMAAKVFVKSFEDISRNDIASAAFSPALDAIGYDWKYYDFDAGLYITRPGNNYLIKTQDGRVYKLHFLDFYNTNGEKGSPLFEFAEL